MMTRWLRRAARMLALAPLLAGPALVLTPAPGAAAPAASGAVVASPAEARVIVKYRAGSALVQAQAAGPRARPLHAAALGQRLGLALADRHVLGARTQSITATGISASALAARLAAQPDVEWALPAKRRHALGVVPNDPLYADGQTTTTPLVGQWAFRPFNNTTVSAIDAEGAWAITTGSSSVTVAVLDTGVRFDHPDLLPAAQGGKLWPGYDFISRTSNSADGNGADADATDPGDTCNGSASSWHGTQVASLIGAAGDNGIGMSGIGRNVMVLPVRVLGQCGGYDDDILAGLRYAGNLSGSSVANPHPAQVINMSLGSPDPCNAAYQDVITELNNARVSVVVSAGNDEGLKVTMPANCSGVVAVAAVRHVGTKVGFSSLGPEVAIAAPGGNCVNASGACLYPLITATNSGIRGPVASTYSTSFNYEVGTSFSAPQVAGTLGLMLSANPALTPAQLKSMLQSTARPFPTVGALNPLAAACRAPSAVAQDECYCTTSTCGAGMLDTGAAVLAAVRAAGSAATATPRAVIVTASDTPRVGRAVTLQGQSSSRAATSLAWSIIQGAGVASLSSTTAAAPTLTVQSAGQVVVKLTVTDASGASGATTRTLNAGTPPVATAVPSNTSPTVGDTVTLDGSGSVASAGRSITSYRWSIASQSGGAQFVSSTNAAVATLSTQFAGSVDVSLTVTDSTGETNTVTTTLQLGNRPVAAFSLSADSVAAGSTVTADSASSTADSSRSLTAWQWSITSGGNAASIRGAADGDTVIVQGNNGGSVVLSLTVTDSAGATATTSHTLQVTGGSSSGGGGALSVAWLLGLALAVTALAVLRRGDASVG